MKGKIKIGVTLFLVLAALAGLVYFVMSALSESEPSAETGTSPATADTASSSRTETTANTEPGSAATPSNSTPNETDAPYTGYVTETQPEDYNYTIFDYIDTSGKFANTGEYTIEITNPYTESGREFPLTLTIGATSQFDKALILNPHCSYSDHYNNRYVAGYWFRSSTGLIWYDDATEMNDQAASLSTDREYYIDRTFDKLHPISYIPGERLGAVWITEDFEMDEAEIGIVLININTRAMIGTVMVDVVRENGKYRISGLRNTQVTDDVVVSLLTGIVKEDITNSREVIIPRDEIVDATVLVELVDKQTYFDTLVSPSHSKAIGNYNIPYPVYAVSMNNSLGPMTYYYAVQEEANGRPVKFFCCGHDAFFPCSSYMIKDYQD